MCKHWWKKPFLYKFKEKEICAQTLVKKKIRFNQNFMNLAKILSDFCTIISVKNPLEINILTRTAFFSQSLKKKAFFSKIKEIHHFGQDSVGIN